MNKLKSLFSKIKPDSNLSKAILKTTLVVLATVLAIITLVFNTGLFVVFILLAFICFFILQIFSYFYKEENKKGRRR